MLLLIFWALRKHGTLAANGSANAEYSSSVQCCMDGKLERADGVNGKRRTMVNLEAEPNSWALHAHTMKTTATHTTVIMVESVKRTSLATGALHSGGEVQRLAHSELWQMAVHLHTRTQSEQVLSRHKSGHLQKRVHDQINLQYASCRVLGRGLTKCRGLKKSLVPKSCCGYSPCSFGDDKPVKTSAPCPWH